MTDVSTRLSLPYLQPAQAQKHVTHNEALRLLDILVQLTVLDRDQTVPPAAPADGDCHIVAAGASGAWAGQDGAIAISETGLWQFIAPKPGWRAHVLSETATVTFEAGLWVGAGTIEATRLGIGTAPDATNRLAVASPATLLTHAGGGHQVKINKAAAGDTASLLFQSGYSGRAELGLAGSDGFGVKVSADGANWLPALTVDPATARVTLPHCETGADANGSFRRLPDGTQICVSPTFTGNIATAKGAIFQSAAFVWTFPAAFIAPPQVSPAGSDDASLVGANAGQATLTQATGRDVVIRHRDRTQLFDDRHRPLVLIRPNGQRIPRSFPVRLRAFPAVRGARAARGRAGRRSGHLVADRSSRVLMKLFRPLSGRRLFAWPTSAQPRARFGLPCDDREPKGLRRVLSGRKLLKGRASRQAPLSDRQALSGSREHE